MVVQKDGHSQILHVVSSLSTACILQCTRVHELETTCECPSCALAQPVHNLCMQAFLAVKYPLAGSMYLVCSMLEFDELYRHCELLTS